MLLIWQCPCPIHNKWCHQLSNTAFGDELDVVYMLLHNFWYILMLLHSLSMYFDVVSKLSMLLVSCPCILMLLVNLMYSQLKLDDVFRCCYIACGYILMYWLSCMHLLATYLLYFMHLLATLLHWQNNTLLKCTTTLPLKCHCKFVYIILTAIANSYFSFKRTAAFYSVPVAKARLTTIFSLITSETMLQSVK